MSLRAIASFRLLSVYHPHISLTPIWPCRPFAAFRGYPFGICIFQRASGPSSFESCRSYFSLSLFLSTSFYSISRSLSFFLSFFLSHAAKVIHTNHRHMHTHQHTPFVLPPRQTALSLSLFLYLSIYPSFMVSPSRQRACAFASSSSHPWTRSTPATVHSAGNLRSASFVSRAAPCVSPTPSYFVLSPLPLLPPSSSSHTHAISLTLFLSFPFSLSLLPLR